jgi:propanol-preferring alcohol dehydrogenase
LSSINDVFERLAHGDVPSRVVLDFAKAPSTAKAQSRIAEPVG